MVVFFVPSYFTPVFPSEFVLSQLLILEDFSSFAAVSLYLLAYGHFRWLLPSFSQTSTLWTVHLLLPFTFDLFPTKHSLSGGLSLFFSSPF